MIDTVEYKPTKKEANREKIYIYLSNYNTLWRAKESELGIGPHDSTDPDPKNIVTVAYRVIYIGMRDGVEAAEAYSPGDNRQHCGEQEEAGPSKSRVQVSWT